MRLAFCNATRAWGGVKTWTLEFAAALRDMGHEVFIYGREGAFVQRAESMNLPADAVRFGPDFSIPAIRYFRQSFRDRGIQAVLVNVGRDLRTAGVAARLAGIPLVQRIGLPGDMRNTLYVRLIHTALRPRYLFPCFFNRDGFLRNLPFVRAEHCTVVHSAKTPVPAINTGVSRPLRLVTTSQLNPDKGHAELIALLGKLRGEGFDFTWDVAGTGRDAGQLRRLAEEKGLGGRVRWHGFLQNVPELLSRCDVFVLPSYSEGLPNTLLEAMAHGLAPVARDVGGIREIWPESLAEFLVPSHPRDGSMLGGALRRVLGASDEEVATWKNAAWEQCKSAFSLDSQARKLDVFFKELIEAGTGQKTGQ